VANIKTHSNVSVAKKDLQHASMLFDQLSYWFQPLKAQMIFTKFIFILCKSCTLDKSSIQDIIYGGMPLWAAAVCFNFALDSYMYLYIVYILHRHLQYLWYIGCTKYQHWGIHYFYSPIIYKWITIYRCL